jgi:hypothetical protein
MGDKTATGFGEDPHVLVAIEVERIFLSVLSAFSSEGGKSYGGV